MIIKDATPAESYFQTRAVLPSPFDFERLDSKWLRGASGQWSSETQVKVDFGRTIRHQQLFFGFVATPREERLVDVKKLPPRIAPAYSISRIFHQCPIQRLRMPQCPSGLFQLGAQVPFVQDSPNGHRQLRQMFPFDVVECS